MERIDENTVQLTDDEQIIGNFFAYLVEERGMTEHAAQKYLGRVTRIAGSTLSFQLMSHVLGRKVTYDTLRAQAVNS